MCTDCGDEPALAVIDHTIDHPFNPAPDTGPALMCRCGAHVSRHPDKFEFLAKQTMDHIIEHGHQVTYVFGDETSEPFAYSVGRTVKDRPEILVTGPLPQDVAHYIVNRIAELDDERDLQPGMTLNEVLDGYPVRLVKVRDLREAQMFAVTSNFGEEDTSAFQVLWPDMDGNFPDEPGYDANFKQPIFS